MQKNIPRRNIHSEEFENSAWINRFSRSVPGFVVHCAMNSYTYLCISRLMQMLFSVVRYALGFMRGLYFLTFCTRQNIEQNHAEQTPLSMRRLTLLRENLRPTPDVMQAGTVIYPEESAAENTNPLPAILANRMQIPGTNGRWCPVCRDYKIHAILKRYGTAAYTADYVPLCPRHKCILWPDKNVNILVI